MIKNVLMIAVLSLVFSCAGIERGCSSGCANHLGGDWIVVQYDMRGEPFACWKLYDVSMTNEKNSDGIYWLDAAGNLIHVGGWYNRVQVGNDAWGAAARSVGVILEYCRGGRYTGK